MKINLNFICASLLAVAGITFARAEQLTLSRQQCVEIALRDNPTVKVADMEVKKMDYSKKEVIAGLFPTIDFSANYQRSIELQTIRMNMGEKAKTSKWVPTTPGTWAFPLPCR